MSHQSTYPEPDVPAIRLFVYGTLKRGCCNHDHFCRDAVSVEPATVRGRLHQLPSGLLVLEVPEEDILAVGTNDPLADALTQRSIEVPAPGSRQSGGQRSVARCTAGSEGTGRFREITGELITFADPMRSLPPIDRLEGFNPGGISLYRRVLLPVRTVDVSVAWAYVLGITSMFPKNTSESAWP